MFVNEYIRLRIHGKFVYQITQFDQQSILKWKRRYILLLTYIFKTSDLIGYYYITKPSNTDDFTDVLSRFVKMMFYGLLFPFCFQTTHQASIRPDATKPAGRPYKSFGFALIR